mgnify:CR=1 FL=1
MFFIEHFARFYLGYKTGVMGKNCDLTAFGWQADLIDFVVKNCFFRSDYLEVNHVLFSVILNLLCTFSAEYFEY